MVIQRVYGPNNTNLTHLSAAGGAHLYILGVGLGSAFAPPAAERCVRLVLLGP